MGNALKQFTDLLGIIPDKLQAADKISRAPVLKLFGGGDGGRSFSDVLAKVAAEVAAEPLTAGPTGPTPSPYTRPRATPDTAESMKADRRRSISSAMRRRAPSILTGSSSPSDTLGV